MLKRNIKISKPRLQQEDLEFSETHEYLKSMSNKANCEGAVHIKNKRFPLADITNFSPKTVSICVPKSKEQVRKCSLLQEDFRVFETKEFHQLSSVLGSNEKIDSNYRSLEAPFDKTYLYQKGELAHNQKDTEIDNSTSVFAKSSGNPYSHRCDDKMLLDSYQSRQNEMQNNGELLTFRSKQREACDRQSIQHKKTGNSNEMSRKSSTSRFKFVKQDPSVSEFMRISNQSSIAKSSMNNSKQIQIFCVNHKALEASFKLFSRTEEQYVYYCEDCARKLITRGFKLQRTETKRLFEKGLSINVDIPQEFVLNTQNQREKRSPLITRNRSCQSRKDKVSQKSSRQNSRNSKANRVLEYENSAFYERNNAILMENSIKKDIETYLKKVNSLEEILESKSTKISDYFLQNKKVYSRKISDLMDEKQQLLREIQVKFDEEIKAINIQQKIDEESILRKVHSIDESRTYLCENQKDINTNLFQGGSINLHSTFTAKECKQIMKIYWNGLKDVQEEIISLDAETAFDPDWSFSQNLPEASSLDSFEKGYQGIQSKEQKVLLMGNRENQYHCKSTTQTYLLANHHSSTPKSQPKKDQKSFFSSSPSDMLSKGIQAVNPHPSENKSFSSLVKMPKQKEKSACSNTTNFSRAECKESHAKQTFPLCQYLLSSKDFSKKCKASIETNVNVNMVNSVILEESPQSNLDLSAYMQESVVAQKFNFY